jgi:soluble lytic murein transglycosylase
VFPRSLALSLLLCACAAGAEVPAAASELVRAEFRAALDHIADSKAPPDSAALRAYLLHPYVVAARLRHELSRVPDGQRAAGLESRIRAFLQRHGEEPVTRELRHDWLGFLGARADWPAFQQAAPAELADLSLRCYALAARLAQRDLDGLREAVLELWLRRGDTPPACRPVFAWIDTSERVSDAEIEQRARFAAQQRVPLPATLGDLLPQRRALMEFWERLMAQPERELQRYVSGPEPKHLPPPPDPGPGEALLEAFVRVAKRDSRQALKVFEPLLEKGPFSEDQRALLKRAHALGLAYDFDPAALNVFRDVPEPALDATSREWRVRTALWHREWSLALEWLEAMPEEQRREPRWRYWRARMLERRQRDQAHALYAEVAKEREYYAFLAAERLGRKPDLRPVPLAEDPALRATLAALPELQRAEELFRCELPALAWQELRHALKDRSPAERAQAARLANTWGWFEPAVRLLSEQQHWDDLALRFPLPFQPEIERAAQDTGVNADWLYAVLRTESLYDARAVSRVGALGLLQLMLPTARQVAKRAALPKPERDDLFRPEVNIALGARYLREMQERFANRFILTLAAYNAGPHRVPDWLPAKPIEGDIWIEGIPYTETRTYVQRALSSLVILSWRRTGEPARLAPLLQPVAAPAQDAAS